MSLVAGLGGARRDACVALATDDCVLGVCPQERITRLRGAGLNDSGLPDEALDELLARSGRRRSDIRVFAAAEAWPRRAECVMLDHHFAHACAAFLPSSFESALIVVCDHEDPQLSFWLGHGSVIERLDWRWTGPGLVDLYSQSAEALGFDGGGREQRMEALARLAPQYRDRTVDGLFAVEGDRLRCAPSWKLRLEELARTADPEQRAGLASAVQSRIGELLLELVADVASRTPSVRHLCVGGSLFFNSRFNTMIKCRGGFDDTYVPANPGNGGLAVGTGMHAAAVRRCAVEPFCGPAYSAEEIKATLDNCKLTYQWTTEAEAFGLAADALHQGRLVGWFDGPMEWGPRALGARSILASPFAPWVLDNLNRFLKHREAWRGYALSALAAAIEPHFIGPRESPFMECDYEPRDRDRFRHILPSADANIRVQSVGATAPRRFRNLLAAFSERSGLPIVVNTSFNAFQEPIVCSPRDAIRVFFGSGIDLLVLGEFVVSK